MFDYRNMHTFVLKILCCKSEISIKRIRWTWYLTSIFLSINSTICFRYDKLEFLDILNIWISHLGLESNTVLSADEACFDWYGGERRAETLDQPSTSNATNNHHGTLTLGPINLSITKVNDFRRRVWFQGWWEGKIIKITFH